jgi:hypothetical protein
MVCSHSGPAALRVHGPSLSYMDTGARFAQESSLSGPAAPRGRRPSYSYVVLEGRFAQISSTSGPAVLFRHGSSYSYTFQNVPFVKESSSHFRVSAYLFAESHLSETACGKQAGIDAPRTRAGTVPRTVPGVTLIGVCRWTSLAVLRPTSAAKGGRNQRGTCRQVLAATGSPTSKPNRIATRRLTCGANCRRTCWRTSVVTSTVFRGPNLGEPQRA